MCRIAFHGVLLHPITEKDYERSVLPRLRIFKLKSKEGVVERVSTLILRYGSLVSAYYLDYKTIICLSASVLMF